MLSWTWQLVTRLVSSDAEVIVINCKLFNPDRLILHQNSESVGEISCLRSSEIMIFVSN